MELGSGCKCSGVSIDLRRLPAGEKNHGREDRQLHGELLEQLLLDARVHAAEVHVGLQVLGHLSFTGSRSGTRALLTARSSLIRLQVTSTHYGFMLPSLHVVS